eukprot:CAMPEP_0170552734 /NCGR_PEP_ID=MMETSP0211-20121228/10624_1 /TAXON_ID=311385 /ORGANISM="Pseudokeronopsis sp., Strain OXSARD2" /LENGTH=91 /DNA_ID=CAMNT_0010860667 /DNA_START=299 /DNA_END=574 /DNA_ORIENTATION=-
MFKDLGHSYRNRGKRRKQGGGKRGQKEMGSEMDEMMQFFMMPGMGMSMGMGMGFSKGKKKEKKEKKKTKKEEEEKDGGWETEEEELDMEDG